MTSQCVSISTSTEFSTAGKGNDDREKASGFSIDAILPKIDYRISATQGPFLSVNNRPISSIRGTGKKLVSIVKEHVKERTSASRCNSNMFILIAIKCHPSRYDPNISPMKDEVMMGDESTLLDCFEGLCRDLYREDTLIASPSVKTTPAPDEDEPAKRAGTGGDSVAGESPDGAARSSSRPSDRDNDEGSRMSPDKDIPPLDNDYESKPVRTVMSVNMLRTTSDATDAACEQDMITMDVLRLPTPAKLDTMSKAKKVTLTQAGASLLSQDTQIYFRPRSIEFEIAEDDTAMTASTDDCRAAPSTRSASRHPLRRLTESALNEHRGDEQQEDESGDEISVDFERYAETLHPSIATGGDLNGSRHQLQFETMWEQNRHGEETSALVHERAMLTGASLALHALQTPPTSASGRRIRNAQLPNQVVAGGAGNRTRARQGMFNTRSQRERGSPELSTLVSSPTRLFNSPFSPLTGRLETVISNPDSIQAIHHTEANELRGGANDAGAGETDVYSHSSILGNHYESIAHQQVKMQPSRWAHAAQLKLMQTPAPESTKTSGTICLPIQRGRVQNAIPGITEASSTQAIEDRHGPCAEDPRRYLIKRQQSMARSGRYKRLLSKKLPLENIGDETHRLVTTVLGGIRGLRPRASSSHQCDEKDNLTGRLEAPGELETTTRRLDAVIRPWAERAHPGIDLTYTLGSIVKGKGVMRDDDLYESGCR